MSASNGSANNAAILGLSGASAVKEKSSQESISTLDQRLSFLTQNNSPLQREIDFGCIKLNCSPEEEMEAVNTPPDNVTGCVPSQTRSACEGHGKDPQVDASNVDIDDVQCIPVSSEGGGTPNSLKTAVVSPVTSSAVHVTKAKMAIVSPVRPPVPVQFVDLVEASATMNEDPDKINLTGTKSGAVSPVKPPVPVQMVDLVEASAAMNEDPDKINLTGTKAGVVNPVRSSLPVQLINLVEAKSAVKDFDIQFPVQSINSPGTRCETQSSDHPCGSKNSFGQDHTVHQLPSSPHNSECPSSAEPCEEDIEIVFVAPKPSDENVDSKKPDVTSEVNRSPVKNFSHHSDNVNGATECVNGELQRKGKSEMQIGSPKDTAVLNGDEEVMVISEQPKVILKKSCDFDHRQNKCENAFYYHIMQTVIALKHLNACQRDVKPKICSHKSSPAKDIVNLYSLLRTAPSRLSNLKNDHLEPDVIVISDEVEEIVGGNFGNSSHLIRRQLTSNTENKTENLEAVDMDLGSSDEEKV